MAFNITVVAFDKEPDLSEETILLYRGFDLMLVDKTTQGDMHTYHVRTSITGAYIRHVQVRDVQVDSPNMVLVFENIIPEEITIEDNTTAVLRERIQKVMTETMLRLKCTNIDLVEGPYFAEGVMGLCFLDVRIALSDDLAHADRSCITAVKK